MELSTSTLSYPESDRDNSSSDRPTPFAIIPLLYLLQARGPRLFLLEQFLRGGAEFGEYATQTLLRKSSHEAKAYARQ